MNKITLKLTAIARDGGTKVYIEKGSDKNIKTIEEAKNLQKYYLDGRFYSKTKGELFDNYPNKENAKILNKENFIFESIKNP